MTTESDYCKRLKDENRHLQNQLEKAINKYFEMWAKHKLMKEELSHLSTRLVEITQKD